MEEERVEDDGVLAEERHVDDVNGKNNVEGQLETEEVEEIITVEVVEENNDPEE